MMPTALSHSEHGGAFEVCPKKFSLYLRALALSNCPRHCAFAGTAASFALSLIAHFDCPGPKLPVFKIKMCPNLTPYIHNIAILTAVVVPPFTSACAGENARLISRTYQARCASGKREHVGAPKRCFVSIICDLQLYRYLASLAYPPRTPAQFSALMRLASSAKPRRFRSFAAFARRISQFDCSCSSRPTLHNFFAIFS